MCQILNGPCAVIQGALPKILKQTPSEFFQAINKKLEVTTVSLASTVYSYSTWMFVCVTQRNALEVFERLRKVPGLKPVMPRGSMYILVGLLPTGKFCPWLSGCLLRLASITSDLLVSRMMQTSLIVCMLKCLFAVFRARSLTTCSWLLEIILDLSAWLMQAFRAPGYFRVVLCASEEKLIEACDRFSEFCSRHYVCP